MTTTTKPKHRGRPPSPTSTGPVTAIRLALKALDDSWTQERLADNIGMTPMSIKRCESQGRLPSSGAHRGLLRSLAIKNNLSHLLWPERDDESNFL